MTCLSHSYGAKFDIAESTFENLERSYAALQESVAKGEIIYGKYFNHPFWSLPPHHRSDANSE